VVARFAPLAAHSATDHGASVIAWLQWHGSTVERVFGSGQRFRWWVIRSRHSSEQYRRFACRVESISTLHVGHVRAPGGTTPPAARIVHSHEQRFAVGGRPGAMT
jgi:hypothetical protein